MVDFRSGFYPYDSKKRLEIVKGKEFSANQTYIISRPRSPDPRPTPISFPTRKSRRSSGSASASTSLKKKSWSMNDPEMKRRKRVIKYKLYAVEGKVKSSFKRGFRWLKDKCSEIVHGF